MKVIGDIYEAAMLPEFWPTALERLSNDLGFAGFTLITIDGVPRWTASQNFLSSVELYLNGGWHEKNEPMERLMRLKPPGFVREIDIFSQEELPNIEIVRDLKRPAGLGWSAAMMTPMPTGETLLLSVEQFWDRGPLSDATMAKLEELRPHLSRAALLAAKLQHQRAEAAVESLEMTGVPAAVVNHRGKVLASNARLQTFAPTITVSAFDRMNVAPPAALALFKAALEVLTADAIQAAPLSIAVPATDATPPLVLHVIPTKGQARDLFGAQTALVVVTAVSARTAPPAAILRALFDLTPSESRIAEALLAGTEKNELLKRLGITEETERSYVKSILRKTGFKGRTDLVRFLGGLAT